MVAPSPSVLHRGATHTSNSKAPPPETTTPGEGRSNQRKRQGPSRPQPRPLRLLPQLPRGTTARPLPSAPLCLLHLPTSSSDLETGLWGFSVLRFPLRRLLRRRNGSQRRSNGVRHTVTLPRMSGATKWLPEHRIIERERLDGRAPCLDFCLIIDLRSRRNLFVAFPRPTPCSGKGTSLN